MNTRSVDLVDFHSHVLPGADHGSDSVSTSIRQLKLAKKYGVTRILATPHFYPHVHLLSDFLARRDASAAELKAAYTDVVPELRLGAEVLICQGLENLDGIGSLCFTGSNLILIELPMAIMSPDLVETAVRIKAMGFEVIIAHADRYDPKTVDEFIDAGINKLQLNASSLATVFKTKHLYEWIKRGYVVAIGSDIHGENEKAYKNFIKATKKLGPSLEYIAKASDELWKRINNFI